MKKILGNLIILLLVIGEYFHLGAVKEILLVFFLLFWGFISGISFFANKCNKLDIKNTRGNF